MHRMQMSQQNKKTLLKCDGPNNTTRTMQSTVMRLITLLLLTDKKQQPYLYIPVYHVISQTVLKSHINADDDHSEGLSA